METSEDDLPQATEGIGNFTHTTILFAALLGLAQKWLPCDTSLGLAYLLSLPKVDMVLIVVTC